MMTDPEGFRTSRNDRMLGNDGNPPLHPSREGTYEPRRLDSILLAEEHLSEGRTRFPLRKFRIATGNDGERFYVVAGAYRDTPLLKRRRKPLVDLRREF